MRVDRKWSYVAEDRNGAIVEGALGAMDLHHALGDLEVQGLTPIDIKEDSGNRSVLGWRQNAKRLRQKDLTQFCTRMADLLNADVSTIKTLHIVSSQAQHASIRDFSDRLQNQIRKGQTLSAALTEDPLKLPNTMIALVSAGESLGDMGGAFSRLAQSFETQMNLRREITSQLIYPAALLVLIILTIIFLSFFVLPQFETVFASASASPPPETQFVLAAASFIRNYWLIVAAASTGSALTLRFFIKHNTPIWDQIALSIPIAGPLLQKIETARYARSLGELLSGGMPLARAMPIAQSAVTNSSITDGLEEIEIQVKNGAPLSIAAAASPCLASDILTFFELGEETGDLGRMITKGASYIEEEVTNFLKRFATLSGPIMTAMMGLMTAGVIAAVMTGVLSLNDTVY
jgi:general secretion pathway protein F